jgi:hypothetical protein
MKKTTMVISAALTTFALLILSGVAYSVKYIRPEAAAGAQAAPAEAAPASPAGFAEREAAYQDLIQQANQRLQQAQAEIDRLKSEQAQASASTAISIEAAAQVAASYLGQTEIYTAEGITIEGQPVYRITFSSGDVVLVSTNGEVLAVQSASQMPGFSSGGQQGYEEDDHEGGEHEEHEHEEHEHDHEEFEQEG